MRILVTGGAGYLGSILVPRLLSEGHQVTVLDNFRYRQVTLLDCCVEKSFRLVRGDCRDEATLRPLVREADLILPLAAIVGAGPCDSDRLGASSINLDAVRLLLSIRSSDQRIIFPCTNSGYGVGEADKFCTEETPLRPISHYGRSKVEAESAVLDSGNAISLRLATVFGLSPRMRLDLLVNDFVYRAVHDRCVTVFEGHFKRNYIHVRDVAEAFVHCLTRFSEIEMGPYNVGLSKANLSKLELCDSIKAQLPDFVYLEAPFGADPDKRDYIVSNAKIEATGFMPGHSLDSGIAELIRGYAIIRDRSLVNV